jgi:hypothetical protein
MTFEGRLCVFSYMPLNKCMLIFGVTLLIRYPFHEIWVSLILNFRINLYESSIFFYLAYNAMENYLMVLILQCTRNQKMSWQKFFKIDIPCKNGNINWCDSLLFTDENHRFQYKKKWKSRLQIFRFDLNLNAMF